MSLPAAMRVPTPLGWTVIGLSVGCAVLATLTSWAELALLSLFFALTVLVSARYAVGAVPFTIDVLVHPGQVGAGGRSVARIALRRSGRAGRRGNAEVEVPLARNGTALGRRQVPVPSTVVDGATVVEVDLPTLHRGVVTVGPIQTIKADPLGLLRRELAWSTPAELVVSPPIVATAGLGGGLLRDLEGQASNQRSHSDVAFHSLREYAVGDDLRQVHALTSARFGRPMVRQFVDTRSARLAIVVSTRRDDFAGPDEFEMALSVGASLAVRGVEDQQPVAVVIGDHRVPARSRQSPRTVLDPFARAEFADGAGLAEGSARLSQVAPNVSIAVLVGGSATRLTELHRAARRFSLDVRMVAVLADVHSAPAVIRVRGLLLVRVSSLADVSRFFSGSPQ